MSGDQRYRVVERLASGGMAEVFLAEAVGVQGFSKRVAIKRVLPELSKKDAFIRMFLDEARLSARISHGNCVQVFDIGVGDDTYFIVMEFVDGADLRTVLDDYLHIKRTFPFEEAVYVGIELCKGLDYAHHLVGEDGAPLGIVHRDVSPPNVLLTKHGEVKIADFGLAKANAQLERSEPGVIKGKYSYLAPETCEGLEVDGRADLFAVAAMLWEVLAGRRLFQGRSDLHTVQLVQIAEVPPITTLRRDVPAALEPILARALARDAAERYVDGAAFGRALSELLHHHGSRPVSGFDIRTVVRDVMERKRRARSRSGSFDFMSEVDAVLLQFESLGADTRKVGATPLDVGSFAPPPPSEFPRSRETSGARPLFLEAAELARLEEDPPMIQTPTTGANDVTSSKPAARVSGAIRLLVLTFVCIVLGGAITLAVERLLTR